MFILTTLLELDFTNDQLIAYSSIIIMALVPIYIGAHRSLEQKIGIESMTQKDAWMFPLVGSCVLFGLYILFKLISEEYLNLLLTSYFLLLGVFCLNTTLRPLVHRLVPQSIKSSKREYFFKIPLPWSTAPLDVKFDLVDVVNTIICLLLTLWYILSKHWIANNILGQAFCIQAIAFISLGTYKIGCTLLGGLFVYDIFWVFGTDVMVTVARKFNAPIKLLFPKELWAEEMQFSMLGLGDIVIPGIFIALLLRYDSYRSKPYGILGKTYFNTTFIAYFLGLATTIVVMHTFQAAQPALLYLVPACIGASFLVSLVLKDFSNLSNYNEEEELKKAELLKAQTKDETKDKKE